MKSRETYPPINLELELHFQEVMVGWGWGAAAWNHWPAVAENGRVDRVVDDP